MEKKQIETLISALQEKLSSGSSALTVTPNPFIDWLIDWLLGEYKRSPKPDMKAALERFREVIGDDNTPAGITKDEMFLILIIILLL